MRWRVVFWLAVGMLAAPASTLTACRLAERAGAMWGPVFRVVAFTPLGVPLYTVLVIVLLLGSLLRQRGSRQRRLVATLVAMVGLGAHLWWWSPQILGDHPRPAAGEQPIVVMNANLYEGRADAAAVVRAVQRDGVDILVTEEITPAEVEALHRAGLGTLLPYQAGAPDPYVAGTMVFANQRITDPVELATLMGSYKMTIGTLTVIATHPVSPQTPGPWRADHRVVLAEAEATHADLIVGDLNATADHVVMQDLDRAGYRDVGELANEGWQPTWPANRLGPTRLMPPMVRIDHVLVRGGDDATLATLAAIGTHTVDIPGTDHLALVATVALR